MSNCLVMFSCCMYSLFSSKNSKTDDLATCASHKKIREAADLEYRKNAERMKEQYTKRKHHQIALYKYGDAVTLRIPRSERAKTDMCRLLCYVLEVKRGLHRLQ